jgi:hypothetical protein
MSGTSFNPNSLIGVQYNVQDVAMDNAVVNGTGANASDITLRNGVYTITPNAGLSGSFQTAVANESGGLHSSEPEDTYGDTGLAFTYINTHPANLNPQPSDPPGLVALALSGYVDGTQLPQNFNSFFEDASTVVGVAKNAAGAVTAVLVEMWSSYGLPGNATGQTPGTGYFDPSGQGASATHEFLVFSTVNNFYTESLSNSYPVQTFTEVTSVTCFTAGTRIAAPGGEVSVETLLSGDLVATASGQLREIAWIGRRSIDCTRHPSPQSVWPVRVAAGAFAPGLPSRDLLLSPDHAVFAEGVLIPVRMLVNGATITQVERSHVSYFHIELATHDVLLAEGLPVESYLDTGNRDTFANAATVALHPRLEPGAENALAWEAYGCAPLKVHGAEVDRVRLSLADRAATLRLDGEPGPSAGEAEPSRSLRLIGASA